MLNITQTHFVHRTRARQKPAEVSVYTGPLKQHTLGGKPHEAARWSSAAPAVTIARRRQLPHTALPDSRTLHAPWDSHIQLYANRRFHKIGSYIGPHQQWATCTLCPDSHRCSQVHRHDAHHASCIVTVDSAQRRRFRRAICPFQKRAFCSMLLNAENRRGCLATDVPPAHSMSVNVRRRCTSDHSKRL